jgi:hypothetical protein
MNAAAAAEQQLCDDHLDAQVRASSSSRLSQHQQQQQLSAWMNWETGLGACWLTMAGPVWRAQLARMWLLLQLLLPACQAWPPWRAGPAVLGQCSSSRQGVLLHNSSSIRQQWGHLWICGRLLLCSRLVLSVLAAGLAQTVLHVEPVVAGLALVGGDLVLSR